MVSADSDNLNVQLGGTNYDPTADTCLVGSTSYTPTENSGTAVTVAFNVSDANGVADLNNTLAKVEFDDALTFSAVYESASNTTGNCATSDINTTTRQYTCTISMLYWYQHATNYSARCYTGDNNDSTTVTADSNNAFAYQKLVASTIDSATVAFGTLGSAQFNTNVSDSNSPITITNTGNAALTTLSITGDNLVQAGKTNISISQFYADDLNITSAQQLTVNKQQITGVSVVIEDSTPGGNTDNLLVWFNVPASVDPGTFTSTWTLWEEE